MCQPQSFLNKMKKLNTEQYYMKTKILLSLKTLFKVVERGQIHIDQT
jgi:hypothetical protein